MSASLVAAAAHSAVEGGAGGGVHRREETAAAGGVDGALFCRVHVDDIGRIPITGRPPRAPPRNKMALFEHFTVAPHRLSIAATSTGGGGLASRRPRRLIPRGLAQAFPRDGGVGGRQYIIECKMDEEEEEEADADDEGRGTAGGGDAAAGTRQKRRRVISTSNKDDDDEDREEEVEHVQRKSSSEAAALAASSRGTSTYPWRPWTSTAGARGNINGKKNISVWPVPVRPHHDDNSIVDINGAILKQLPYSGGSNLKLLQLLSASSTLLSVEEEYYEEHSKRMMELDGDEAAAATDDRDRRTCRLNNRHGDEDRCHHRRPSPLISRGHRRHPPRPIIKSDCKQMRISNHKIVPRHVIAAIGQQEFWKARRTILQQQKMLSSQVFELHRLTEVQRLLAGMPDLLLQAGLNLPSKASSSASEDANDAAEADLRYYQEGGGVEGSCARITDAYSHNYCGNENERMNDAAAAGAGDIDGMSSSSGDDEEEWTHDQHRHHNNDDHNDNNNNSSPDHKPPLDKTASLFVDAASVKHDHQYSQQQQQQQAVFHPHAQLPLHLPPPFIWFCPTTPWAPPPLYASYHLGNLNGPSFNSMAAPAAGFIPLELWPKTWHMNLAHCCSFVNGAHQPSM